MVDARLLDPSERAAEARHQRGALDLARRLPALLVAATHYPKPERLLGRNPPSDKLLHFMAYGVLGALAAAALRSRGRWSGRTIAALAGGLALFAALDEITQPFFARAADPLDWVFDCIGIAGGILLVVTISSLVSARGSR